MAASREEEQRAEAREQIRRGRGTYARAGLRSQRASPYFAGPRTGSLSGSLKSDFPPTAVMNP